MVNLRKPITKYIVDMLKVKHDIYKRQYKNNTKITEIHSYYKE